MAAVAAKQPLDPLFYDVEVSEEDISYDRWFRAKVQEALDSKKPALPHDEAMTHVDALLEERRKARASA
ncbi:stability determinant [Ventosimonas gracilis]|uniref:Stability determinant n=1 Tax=Ventosimonas gracilis TaxID=1680762 RepID=A0A139SM07_9GAMM|nr:stability determinant [Ventosimonas gracilis]KXU35588.1 stability determinant [Ventosimonas gracilis]